MNFYTLTDSKLQIHNRVFIACISRHVQIPKVLDLLCEYGDVEEFDMPLGDNGCHKGVAFAAYTTVAAAQDAIKDLDGFHLNHRPIVVHEHSIDSRRTTLIQVEIAKIDARHPPLSTAKSSAKPAAVAVPKKLALPDLPSHLSRTVPWATVNSEESVVPTKPEKKAAPLLPTPAPPHTAAVTIHPRGEAILPKTHEFVPLQTPDNDELPPPPYSMHAPPNEPVSPAELAGSLGFSSTEWQLHNLRVMMHKEHGIAPLYLFQPTEPHTQLETC